jgi:hypothetical protein
MLFILQAEIAAVHKSLSDLKKSLESESSDKYKAQQHLKDSQTILVEIRAAIENSQRENEATQLNLKRTKLVYEEKIAALTESKAILQQDSDETIRTVILFHLYFFPYHLS